MRCYCISKRAFRRSNLNHRIGEMDKHVILQQVSVMEEWTCHESGKINCQRQVHFLYCQRQVHGTAAACRLQLQLLFFLSAVPSFAPIPDICNCQRQVHGTAACRLQMILFFLSAVPSLAPTPTRSDLSTYNI